MLLRRIVLLYIVLLLCRIVFYCYNYALIGPLGWQEVLTLAGGGLKFDTVSVLYANLLFIVLSLLPFHFRERSWYRRILFWYYAVINSLLIVAVNLADCVYFRYTQKRFTADEIFFADNSNSAQLVLKFAAENWYLLLVGAALIWLLVWGYGRKITPRSPLREGWVYYSVNTGLLVIAILLGIAGNIFIITCSQSFLICICYKLSNFRIQTTAYILCYTNACLNIHHTIRQCSYRL